MMDIRLISLTLENFKGINYFKFDADGKNVSIYGTNGSGKTTLADAYFWLLFGKDSNGITNFDIKTIGTTGLNYTVIGAITVNGNMHTLQRTLNEKWERKNGETEKKLKGNTTTYIIDGVPVKEKEYKAFVENELVDEKTYQTLTDPDFFAGKTDWKKRRAQLLEWFASVSDEDIIAAHEELQPLKKILDGRTVENAQKAIQADRKKLNDLLKEIPNRIDEQQRNITEIQSSFNGDEQENLDRLLKEKSDIEDNIRKAESDESLNKAKAEVERIRLEISKARADYANISRNEDTEKQLMNVRKDKFKLQCNLSELNETVNSLDRKLETISEQGKTYNSRFLEISAKTFSGDTVCPYCGQAMPEDKVQTAVEEFNRNKSEQLEKIKNDCTKLKKERAEIKAKKAEISGNIDELNALILELDNVIKKLSTSIITPEPFESTNEYKILTEKLQQAENNVRAEEQRFSENTAVKVSKWKTRIEEINRQCSDLRTVIANNNTIHIYETRIEQLKNQEKDYGRLLARADNELMLIDEFIKAKCNDVEKMINSHFRIVKWKLFELQVNGGVNDCCEATVDEVDYSTNLNSAAKLNAGLDIINTISEVKDVYVPIWIDNAESVVEYEPTKSQTIRLTVSADYKKLTVKE